jgi:hypothetical protein
VAGPWFTVQKSSDTWHTVDRIWISNGRKNSQARVEIKLKLPVVTQSPVVSAE